MLSKDHSFESERLSYRGIAAEDANLIVAWRSDPANYRNFLSPHPLTLEEHMNWFGRYLKSSTRFDFVIIDPDGAKIGTVGLSGIGSQSCEVSYMIGDISARGRGYAKEALRAASVLAFEVLGVEEVVAHVAEGNVASVKVAESVGFMAQGPVPAREGTTGRPILRYVLKEAYFDGDL